MRCLAMKYEHNQRVEVKNYYVQKKTIIALS